jgi:hypothetical protein
MTRRPRFRAVAFDVLNAATAPLRAWVEREDTRLASALNPEEGDDA